MSTNTWTNVGQASINTSTSLDRSVAANLGIESEDNDPQGDSYHRPTYDREEIRRIMADDDRALKIGGTALAIVLWGAAIAGLPSLLSHESKTDDISPATDKSHKVIVSPDRNMPHIDENGIIQFTPSESNQ